MEIVPLVFINYRLTVLREEEEALMVIRPQGNEMRVETKIEH